MNIPSSLSRALLLTALCAALPAKAEEAKRPIIERIDSGDGRITQVEAQPAEVGMKVSGNLQKPGMAWGAIPGRLHVEVFSDDGVRLAEASPSYHRRSRRPQTWHFSVELRVPFTQAARVRVTHHGPGG